MMPGDDTRQAMASRGRAWCGVAWFGGAARAVSFDLRGWVPLEEQARWLVFRSLADDGRDIRAAFERSGLSRRRIRRYVFDGGDIDLSSLAYWFHGVEYKVDFSILPREEAGAAMPGRTDFGPWRGEARLGQAGLGQAGHG